MITIDRRYFRYFNWTSFGAIMALSLIGLMTVFSATYLPGAAYSIFFKKQALGIVTGLIIYIVCASIDFRHFQRWGYFLFFISIFGLILTAIAGSVGMGGQRWINLGLFKFQPSESAKILYAPYLSFYLSTEPRREWPQKPYPFTVFITPLLVLVFTSLVILKQPDLGTAIIVSMTGITLLWLAGLPRRFIIACALVGLVLAPLAWHSLRPYQKKRVAVFMGYGDERAEGYQIEQSKIAIGSGGLFGKGFLRGTQNKLQFLPEGRTDFIFSVFCEEWGFAGALILLALYTLLFLSLLTSILTINDIYAQLMATGLALPLLYSTLINIGMVTGLLPIVGIPLPFMTYGISHLWMSYISTGLIQSIIMRSHIMGRKGRVP